jgi:uncharacterized protein
MLGHAYAPLAHTLPLAASLSISPPVRLDLLRIISSIMRDSGFEWDDAKAAQNYAEHGVTFEAARDVFRDPFAIEQIDDRHDYGEERWTVIGAARGRLLFVAYTMRGESIRIISARETAPDEQREYHEQNARGEA